MRNLVVGTEAKPAWSIVVVVVCGAGACYRDGLGGRYMLLWLALQCGRCRFWYGEMGCIKWKGGPIHRCQGGHVREDGSGRRIRTSSCRVKKDSSCIPQGVKGASGKTLYQGQIHLQRLERDSLFIRAFILHIVTFCVPTTAPKLLRLILYILTYC